MRNADALSRSVNVIGKCLVLSKEIIRCEQKRDDLCIKYKVYENFWNGEDGMMYRQRHKEQPRVVIAATPIHTVSVSCH